MDENGTLRAWLEQRVRELEAEYERGRQTLAGLEAQVGATREALLRIEGAITVLREQLNASRAADPSSQPDVDVSANGHVAQGSPAV